MTAIIKKIAGLIFPAAVLFGVYIMLYSETSTGGGFAGGIVVASSFILLTLAFGASHQKINRKFTLALASYGAIGFIIPAFVRMTGFVPAKGVPLLIFERFVVVVMNISIGTLFAAGLFSIFISLAALRIGPVDKEQA
jgi:multicomponent Na+:H+ antiporter subunit B